MLHDYLTEKGVRKDCTITLVLPLSAPVPPSPATSAALIQAFKERDIAFHPNRRMTAVEKNVAVLDDGTRMPFDLMLGVPKNRAPDVVVAAGMTVDGWVPIDVPTLQTKYEGVYAVGDIAATGTPKAGVFAEDAARAVAKSIIAKVAGGDGGRYRGAGSCYIEFGGGRVARVDVDFLSGPTPTGAFNEPTVELVQEKVKFGATRRARWFGL
jgi:sulfide:quinone oxidoreductase